MFIIAELNARQRTAADLLEQVGWAAPDNMLAGDGRLSVSGALTACLPENGDTAIIETVRIRGDWAWEWEHSGGLTTAEVTAMLRAETTAAHLEEAFSPQWAEIITLIREAKTLTPSPDPAESISGGKPWNAMVRVMISGDRYKQWYVSQKLAFTATNPNTRPALLEAVDALIVRDLIGQHGFTQGHYDSLVQQWREMVGPVHPDDADTREAAAPAATKLRAYGVWEADGHLLMVTTNRGEARSAMTVGDTVTEFEIEVPARDQEGIITWPSISGR